MYTSQKGDEALIMADDTDNAMLLSDNIDINTGTRQGCNLSPSIFNIYLNDLPTVLGQNNCDPVLLYDKYINILMYADDVVLLSSSKRGFQNCLNIFEQYCKRWKLIIYQKKTKIVLLNLRKLEKFFSKLLSHADNYCYLGIIFNRNGTFKQGLDNLTTKGKNLILVGLQNLILIITHQ